MYSFQFGRVSIISGLALEKIEFYETVFKVNIPVSDQYNKFLFLDIQKITQRFFCKFESEILIVL
jgi:hypothetical protein